ncbi:MAG: HAMP domain-containing protein [Myxococcales bacterium]|nr:MAG: HAMP domain-containing protein [Myxococcales bacterium]
MADEEKDLTIPEEALPKRTYWYGILEWLQKLSMRNRLFLAFVVLIVSSASATIFIGNAVFNRKVEDLVSAKVEMDLKVAEQMFTGRLERMKLIAHALATRTDRRTVAADYQKFFLDEPPLDFFLLDQGDLTTLIYMEERGSSTPAIRAAPNVSPPVAAEDAEPPEDETKYIVRALSEPADVAALKPTALVDLADAAQLEAQPHASIAILDDAVAERLGYAESGQPSMFMLAAAPIKGGGALVLGRRLNGNNELAFSMHDLIATVGNQRYKTTVFMRDERISTTIRDALGSRADPKIARTVLEKGQDYVGAARLMGEIFFTAYSPIRDERGRVVGMLGIGTSEDIYRGIQRRTTILFSSLIVGGMVFGFLMSYLFSAWLLRPVRELAEGMEKVAKGDLVTKLRILSGSELVQVAKSFNTMVGAVRERDIKLRQITEEQLSRMEKQISIGRLAAGVAHEINNPLTAVLSLSSLLLKHAPPEDPRHEDLTLIVEETQRCRDIVNSLLDFARERQPQKKFVDINQILKDTLLLTNKYHKGERIKKVIKLKPEPLIVNGDSRQLIQVFTNLVLNAAEAIEGEGSITISADEDSSGAFVEVRVADTGKGISKEHLRRVFEPFFTTKGASKGTGLGLSVSMGIVRKHDGNIEIESEEGKGTRVTVLLPRVEGELLI